MSIHLQLLKSKRQCPVARSSKDGFCQALTAKGCEPCLYYCFRSLEAQLQTDYPLITIGMQDLSGSWWLVLLEGAAAMRKAQLREDYRSRYIDM